MPPAELQLDSPGTLTTTRTYTISGWRGNFVVPRLVSGMSEQALIGLLSPDRGDTVTVEVRATIHRPSRSWRQNGPGTMGEAILCALADGEPCHCNTSWRREIARVSGCGFASVQGQLQAMVKKGEIVRVKAGWYRLAKDGE